MSRAEFIKTATPQLVAEVRMYQAAEGGRAGPAYSGWGCPCMVSRMEPLVGYDALPFIGKAPLFPGETRRLGFVFLSHEEAVPIMRAAGRFYLWEGRFVGEATVVGFRPKPVIRDPSFTSQVRTFVHSGYSAACNFGCLILRLLNRPA